MNTKEISFPLPQGGLSKSQLKTEVGIWIESSPLSIQAKYALLKRVSDLSASGLKMLKASLWDALESEGLDVDGMQITTQTIAEYDYSHDEQWNELKEREKEIKASIKEREALMRQAAKPGKIIIEEETGEEIPAALRTGQLKRIITKY